MKTVQINKIKYRIFEEDELKEKLGMNQKDIGLILEYQRLFPELLQDSEGFCIDARKLYEQLLLKQDFSHWIKNQIDNLDLNEHIDYTSLKTNCTTMRPRGSIEYYLTIDSAEDICMTIGNSNRTNKETKEISKMVRNYFKIMTKTIRNYDNWNKIREPEKQNANVLKSTLKSWASKNFMNCDENGIYAREFNMLNQNLTDKTALEIKTYLGYKDKQTREHLSQEINLAIDSLQIFDINLLKCNTDFQTRSNMIKQICDSQYLYIKENFK